MDLTKSLPKVACVDTLKKCNEIEPFSKTVLEYGKNPASGKKYTQEEKDEKSIDSDNKEEAKQQEAAKSAA